MTINTVHLRTDDLAPILLRRPFEMALTRDKAPAVDANGQPVFYAEAVIPGLVPGRFSFEPGLGAVRLRVLGANPDVHGVVQLAGKVTITATYARGQRMSDRNSHITVTAERVRQANPGQRPGGRGFLPAYLPVNGTLLDARPQSDGEPGGRWVADLALEASSSYVVDGMAEVIVSGPVPDGLYGAMVRPVELNVRFTAPDTVDVSQRSRAELLLSAAYLEEVTAGTATPPTPARGRRSDEAQPDADAA